MPDGILGCPHEEGINYPLGGCASLFTYCTQVLHLSEDAAYNRTVVARAALTFPTVLTCLARGDVSLTAVRRLVPVLTPENVEQLLAAARHKSKSEVEQLVAGVRPRPDVAAVIRKLPAPPKARVAPPLPPWSETSREDSHCSAAPPTASLAMTPAPAPAPPTASAPATRRSYSLSRLTDSGRSGPSAPVARESCQPRV